MSIVTKTKTIILCFIISLIFSTSQSLVYAKLFKTIDKKATVYNTDEKLNYINFKWWEGFDDPYLKEYLYRGVLNNHDAKKASWKSEEYRQFTKTTFAKELPMLSVTSSYLGINTPNFNGNTETSENTFILPFFMKYEADLLLKNRDKTKSSQKSFLSTKYEEKGVYITLTSNIASTYINIIKLDKNIEIFNKLMCAQCEIYSREKNKFNRGVISASELNNIKKELDNISNNLNEQIKQREKLLNQLAVLIGDCPENNKGYQRSSFDHFDYNKEIPKCICSDKTFSRPDIMASEELLAKYKIDIRIAKKEFFPSFNIIGVYSFNTAGPGNFFSWEASSAAIIAAATQDIFKGGMKIANLRMIKAKYEQAFETYKQTELIALQEVNDSLIAIKEDTLIDKQTQDKLTTTKDNNRRNINRYKSGVISKIELLDSEKNVLLAEQETTNSKTARLINYISLYKSVGGNL